MRAFWYDRPGPAAEVMQSGELPDPEPAPGEVRVRVAVSGLNPTDIKRRLSGRELGALGRIIPNNDGAGVIDGVGAGVAESRIGERVWLFGAQAMRANGTAAGYTVVPSRQAIALPDNASLDDGACLGVPAVTGHRSVFADGSPAGLTVLVAGAAGRVGRYAVQFAKWAGARVIATVGASPGKAEHVRALGADHVLDYTRDDIVAEVERLTGGAGVDRVSDPEFGANIRTSAAILKRNGVVVSYGSDIEPEPALPFHELMYGNLLVRPVGIFGMPAAAQDEAFAHITRCLEDGVLTHLVGRRFAFEDMVAAHESVEKGSVFGSPLIDIGS